MESHRCMKPEEDPRLPAPGLEPGLGSLLPPDADDEEPSPGALSQPADGEAEPVTEHATASPAASALSARPIGQTRDLNEVVHQILVVGLVISTTLLLIGLLMELLAARALPAAALPPGEAVTRVLKLDPSGFISLGMLVLVFTPIVRVIGSCFVFLYERDWLYFGVTLLVFLIMAVSVILGRV
jgi:uncharacterized membrane protein